MKKKFTDLVDFVGGKPVSFEGTKSYISTGALKGTTISKEDTELVEFDNRPSRADLEVKKGDILFAKMAFTDKRILIDDDTSNYIYSTGFFAVRAKPNVITTECLYYLLNSKTFKDQKDANSTGATQKAITNSGLKKIYLKIPKYNNQKEIAKILSNVEKIINFKENQLKEYDQLIKSRFVEMFTDINLNVKKDNWIKLGKITEIVTGTTPSTNDETNWDGKHLWITPAELNEDSFYVYDTNRKITDKGLASKSLRIMPVDTVLLSTRAPIGKTAIVGNPMTCNQGFKNFICGDNLNPIYLFSLLKFNKDYLNSIGTGTTFKEISKTTISNVEIPVPSINLQNEFAKFVQQVDKLKFEVQKSLDESQILFDSLMQEYFG